MRTTRVGIAMLLVVSAAPLARAQQPGMNRPGNEERREVVVVRQGGDEGMAAMHAGGNLAGMLLAHTGELKLTDQQVTRLAAIARRSADRHATMHASMDSMMRANRSQPGAMQMPPAGDGRTRQAMDRTREQERADVREALAVLSPDQLADAWMMRGAPAGPAGMQHQTMQTIIRRPE